MLPDVQLLFHPNTTNCLAWSDDGELAIAAGEYVHILVSRDFPATMESNSFLIIA